MRVPVLDDEDVARDSGGDEHGVFYLSNKAASQTDEEKHVVASAYPSGEDTA